MTEDIAQTLFYFDELAMELKRAAIYEGADIQITKSIALIDQEPEEEWRCFKPSRDTTYTIEVRYATH